MSAGAHIYVGRVLACCSLGVLWPQSDFIGNTSWNGGQREPNTGGRASAKRQKSPLVLSLEEVILLVFLDGAESSPFLSNDCQSDALASCRRDTPGLSGADLRARQSPRPRGY